MADQDALWRTMSRVSRERSGEPEPVRGRDEHDRRQNERRNQGRGLQRSCWICLAAPGVGCTTDNGFRVSVAGVPFVHDLRWHGGPILVPAEPGEAVQDDAWRRW